MQALYNLLFQTSPHMFLPFFRTGVGRRAYDFRSAISGFFVVLAAGLIRLVLPGVVNFYPLQYLPNPLWPSIPSGALKMEFRPYIELGTAPGVTVPIIEVPGFWFLLAFVLFAIMRLAAGFIQLARIRGSVTKKMDPNNTRYWGNSRLERAPMFRDLSHEHVVKFCEPGTVALFGSIAFYVEPILGIYILATAVSMLVYQVLFWRDLKHEELNARDQLVMAEHAERIHNMAAARAVTRAEPPHTTRYVVE